MSNPTHSRTATDGRSQGKVLGPDDGASYWQPVPANGYVTVKLSPEVWDGPFSMGIQVIAPKSHVRKHAHERNHEAIFVWQGQGRTEVGGTTYPMLPGTIIVLPPHVEHTFVNDSDDDLKLVWIMAPHGLEDFFQAIGRPRTVGEPAPVPFPRPENVLEIERRTVFKAPVE